MLARNGAKIHNWETGWIETVGAGSHGMVARNGSAAYNNYGSIVTSGYAAHGMVADTGSYANNYGGIITHGTGSHGIVTDGDSHAQNSGVIFTHGPDAYGMFASNSSSVANFDYILTSGNSSIGMYAFVDSNATNLNSIVTSGDAADGMIANSNSSATNYGEITTNGSGASGMFATNGASIYNSAYYNNLGNLIPVQGDIETSGAGSHGMVASDDSYAQNSGSIITHGEGSYGMYATGGSEAYNYGSIEIYAPVWSRGGMAAWEGSYAENGGSIETFAQDAVGMSAYQSDIMNSGSIVTHGYRAQGMVADSGSMATNSLTGTIITWGEYAIGMSAETSSDVYNEGTIVTSGDAAHGMVAEENSTATNYGDITTHGDAAYGMLALDTSEIYNILVETIETWGAGSHGMVASDDSYAENSGSIITHDDGSCGMYALNNSSADNSGSIMTSGYLAIGMHANSGSSAVNSGDIVTSGESAYGMGVFFGSAVNSGSIVTSGYLAMGMRANGASAFNSGDIVTSGEGAHGMYAEFISSAVNSGGIVTSGEGAHGMVAQYTQVAGYPSTGSNYGEITTHGDNAYGMYADNVSSADNYGTIETSGVGSHGMVISGDSYGYNAGTITVTGAGSDAVHVVSSDFVNTGTLENTLGNALTATSGSFVRLLDGSLLSGDVTIDNSSLHTQGKVTISGLTENLAGSTLKIEPDSRLETGTYYQDVDSILYLYANADSATDTNAIPLWVENHASISGGLTIDMSTATMPGLYTFIRVDTYDADFDTFFVNDEYFIGYGPQWIEVSSFHYTSMIGYSFSEAALGLVAGIDDWSMLRWVMANHLQDAVEGMKDMETGETKIHAQVLAGQTKRDPSSELAAGVDSTRKGLSLGIDQKKSEDTMWGMYAGYTEAEIDFSGLPMVNSDWENQDTWHLGGYISKKMGNWILSDTLTYRSTDHDTFRAQFDGDAKASFDSWAITNDIRAGYVAKEIGPDSHWQIIPEIGLNVGYFDRGGYTETNGFTYGDFDTTVVESVLGVRFKGEYLRDDGSRFSPQLRLSWVHVLSGEDITINQSWGTDEHWFTENLNDDYFVADLGFSLYNRNNMDISLNYNGRFSDSSTSHGGWLRLQWKI